MTTVPCRPRQFHRQPSRLRQQLHLLAPRLFHDGHRSRTLPPIPRAHRRHSRRRHAQYRHRNYRRTLHPRRLRRRRIQSDILLGPPPPFPSAHSCPLFSENGTNHSKNATATFYAAGNYTFTVSIRTLGGVSPSPATSTSPVSQTLTKITVNKSQPNLANAATLQFTAIGLDQFNNPMTISPHLHLSPSPTAAPAAASTTPASTRYRKTPPVSTPSPSPPAKRNPEASSPINIVSGTFRQHHRSPNGFALAQIPSPHPR